MAEDDHFLQFKKASTALSAKVELLLAQVASLDNENSEVIMYTDKNGTLPDISNRKFACTSRNCSGDQSLMTSFASMEVPTQEINVCEGQSASQMEAFTSRSNVLIKKNITDNIVKLHDFGDVNLSVMDSSRSTQTDTLPSTLSEFVIQHSRDLNAALMNFNVAPSKRERFLRETEENLCSLLLSSNADLQSAGQVQINSGKPIADSPVLKEEKRRSSCLSPNLEPEDSETICTDPYSLSNISTISQQIEVGKTTWPIEIIPGKNKPSISPPKSVSMLSDEAGPSRRRRELFRANRRLQSFNLPSEAACNAVNAGLVVYPPKSALPITTASSQLMASTIPTLSLQPIDSVCRASLEPQSEHNGAWGAVNDRILTGDKPDELICPCSNRVSCPLGRTKQRLYVTDPRVKRGFTHLAALFRGQFVRLLFRTRKVVDLIRLVKDTAQLALSIHIDLEVAANASHPHATASVMQPGGGELLLQSRLMAQLREALSQLHDIFFTWDFSRQQSLMTAPGRPATRGGSAQSRSLKPGNLPAEAGRDQSQPMNDDCAENWEPSAAPRMAGPPLSQPASRVFRLLQSHQTDRVQCPPPSVTHRSSGQDKDATPAVPSIGTDRSVKWQSGQPANSNSNGSRTARSQRHTSTPHASPNPVARQPLQSKCVHPKPAGHTCVQNPTPKTEQATSDSLYAQSTTGGSGGRSGISNTSAFATHTVGASARTPVRAWTTSLANNNHHQPPTVGRTSRPDNQYTAAQSRDAEAKNVLLSYPVSRQPARHDYGTEQQSTVPPTTASQQHLDGQRCINLPTASSSGPLTCRARQSLVCRPGSGQWHVDNRLTGPPPNHSNSRGHQWYPVKQRIVARCSSRTVDRHPIPSTHSPVANSETSPGSNPALKATWSLE